LSDEFWTGRFNRLPFGAALDGLSNVREARSRSFSKCSARDEKPQRPTAVGGTDQSAFRWLGAKMLPRPIEQPASRVARTSADSSEQRWKIGNRAIAATFSTQRRS